MSTLRPETVSAKSDAPCLHGGTAYFAIYQAVKAQDGLIHGKLHAYGNN